MGLLKTVLKGVALANRYAAKFDVPATVQDPASKAGQVHARIQAEIVDLVPALCPEKPFTILGGVGVDLLQCNLGRWRLVSIRIAGQNGQGPDGAANLRYLLDVTIEIGYPPDENVSSVDSLGVTHVFPVAQLKASDGEQLDYWMRSGNLFADDNTLGPSPAVVSLGAMFDLGNTVRRHRWQVMTTRTF